VIKDSIPHTNNKVLLASMGKCSLCLSSLPPSLHPSLITLGCRARVETHLPTSTSHSLTVLSKEALIGKGRKGGREGGREGGRKKEKSEFKYVM